MVIRRGEFLKNRREEGAPRIYEEGKRLREKGHEVLGKLPIGGVEYFPTRRATQIGKSRNPACGDLRYNVKMGSPEYRESIHIGMCDVNVKRRPRDVEKTGEVGRMGHFRELD